MYVRSVAVALILGAWAAGCETRRGEDCTSLCTDLYANCTADCDQEDDQCTVTCTDDRDLCVGSCDEPDDSGAVDGGR